MTTTTPIEIERGGHVAHIWLNRPGKLNALDRDALEAIPAAFGALATDFEVRVAVLGGRGRSFCAGVDLTAIPGADRLREGSGATERERRHLTQLGGRAVRAIRECEVPTIARVHGHAIGGGALIAIACDFRVMTSDAVFAIPEIDLGLPLTWGGIPLLIAEVGAAHARELIMLGEHVGADEAVRVGLSHRSVPAEDLDETVEDLARRLAGKPEAAMHITKTQFRAYGHMSRAGDVTEADGDLIRAAGRSAFRGVRPAGPHPESPQ